MIGGGSARARGREKKEFDQAAAPSSTTVNKGWSGVPWFSGFWGGLPGPGAAAVWEKKGGRGLGPVLGIASPVCYGFLPAKPWGSTEIIFQSI